MHIHIYICYMYIHIVRTMLISLFNTHNGRTHAHIYIYTCIMYMYVCIYIYIYIMFIIYRRYIYIHNIRNIAIIKRCLLYCKYLMAIYTTGSQQLWPHYSYVICRCVMAKEIALLWVYCIII